MPDGFIDARPAGWAQFAGRTALPFVLPRLGVAGVEYDAADLERLRALRPHTVLLTPNHPTNTEPALLFHLSVVVRQPFYYLACRESFDHLWGYGAGLLSIGLPGIDSAAARRILRPTIEY